MNDNAPAAAMRVGCGKVVFLKREKTETQKLAFAGCERRETERKEDER